MTIDVVTIFLRCFILIVLTVISQLAFHRKQYKVMFWSLAFWLTIFRLLILRTLKIYAHQNDPNILTLQNNLMYGLPALVTDFILTISALPLYIWMKDTYQVWKKESADKLLKSK